MTDTNDRKAMAAGAARAKPTGFGDTASRNVPAGGGEAAIDADFDWSLVDDYLADREEQAQLLQQFLQTANGIGDRDIANLPPAFQERVLRLRAIQQQTGNVDRALRGWTRPTPIFELPGQARPALEPGSN